MSKWMCDVKGNQPTSEHKLQEVAGDLTHENLETFIGDRGNLPTAVKEHIKSLGYTWTDSGGGCCSWHIGVPFDDFFDAVHYMLKMTIQFRTAIAAGLLKFELKTWSPANWK